MITGIYVGELKNLTGERALLRPDPLDDGRYLAQFDSYSTAMAHGWYPFPCKAFRLDPAVDWSEA